MARSKIVRLLDAAGAGPREQLRSLAMLNAEKVRDRERVENFGLSWFFFFCTDRRFSVCDVTAFGFGAFRRRNAGLGDAEESR